MERRHKLIEDHYYHVYNRGVDKRIIFTNTYDYNRFVLLMHILNTKQNLKIRDLLKGNSFNELLQEKNKDPIVAIGAYCLMPNHFHLLITPLTKDGISKFMLKLQTAYSMYFNNKNKRSGALFQGVFKSEYVDDDVYMRYLYSYIHLNPAKLKDKKWKESGPKDFNSLKDFVLSYKYSSIGEHLKKDFLITSPKFFPEYKKEYKTEDNYFKAMIDDWLNYKKEL